MKKKLVAFVAVIMSVFLSFTALTGCNLITVDNERDMNQVVATVNIGNEGVKTDEILKRDMVMMYLNYGSSLSSSYSQSQIFEILISQLINNRILVQSAMKSFEDDESFPKNTTKDKYDAARYLTTEDKTVGEEITELSDVNEAKYQTIKSINDLIDNYVEDVEEKVGDTLSEDIRTTPTDAANKELTAKEKSDYIAKGVDTGINDKKRRKAYNNVLKLLESNSLLGDDYVSDITQTTYYKELLDSSYESILIEKYEDTLKAQARAKVTYQMLEDKYVEMYEGQQNDYGNNETDFASALSSATADNPVIYTPFGGYVYVYNLLLGASDEQTAAITKIREDYTDETEIARQRRKVLSGTVAKDLRSTWIQSGYDFDFSTKKFTGDYAYLENSIAFQGEVTKLKDKTDTESAEYRVDSVKEFKLDEFISFVENYLYGSTKDSIIDSNLSIYRKVEIADKPADYTEKINELLFAFSTDGGSLNTNKGYVVAPKPDFDGSETYMQEFADAARKLIGMGGYSYIIAATDYGYHFMFLSEIISANGGYATLGEYLESLGITDGASEFASLLANWSDADENSYLYKFIDLYADADTAVSKSESALFNKYNNDENCVKKYKDAYADLLG